MPTVSVRIDSHSKYTIEFDDEYSPQEFIGTAQHQIEFVKEIVSGHKRLNPPEAQADSNQGQGAAPDKATALPEPIPKSRHGKSLPALTLLIVVCGAGAVYFWHSGLGPFSEEKAPVPQVVQQEAPAKAPEEGLLQGRSSVSPPPESLEKKNVPPLPDLNKITFAAREPTWMRIAEDGNPPYEVMLRPGDKLEREAVNFAVKIGNAKGVDVTFNNKRLRLGQTGSDRQRNVVFLRLPGH